MIFLKSMKFILYNLIGKKGDYLLTILILFTLLGSLIYNNHALFSEKEYSSYFFLLVGCSGLSLYLLIYKAFIDKEQMTINLTIIDILFFCYILFVIIHTLIIKSESLSNKTYIFLFWGYLYLGFRWLVSNKIWNISISLIIVLAGFLECIVCIFQLIKVVPSLNNEYPVTGSFLNPNALSIFLCLTVSSALNALSFVEKKQKYFIGAIILLISCIIFITKCRTAMIGLILIVMIWGFYKTNRFWIKKNNYLLKTIIIVGAIVISSFILYGLYIFKQQSAEGRLFVWKLTEKIISNNPIAGIGYQNFEKTFNTYQADYFRIHGVNGTESLNVGQIRFAFNDYLEEWAKGGVFALLILVSLVITAILYGVNFIRRNPDEVDKIIILAAISVVVGVMVMSVMNYVLCIIPVVFIFTYHLTQIAAKSKNIFSLEPKRFYFRSMCLVIIAILIITSANQINTAIKKIQLRNAISDFEKGNFEESNKGFDKLEKSLSNDWSFLYYRGSLFLQQKNYLKALTDFNRALEFNFTYSLLLNAGECYESLNMFVEAEKCYSTASFQIPSMLIPKYKLFKLYLKTNNSIQALRIARTISKLKIKVPSQYITYIQEEVNLYIQKAI